MENILERFGLTKDPLASFQSWFDQAQSADKEADAFTLATATPEGVPSARMLLFKGIIQGQLTWYTHTSSRKGRELLANPRAAMVFYWRESRRQVRISGKVQLMSKQETEQYFSKRAKLSQVASYISAQSEPIEGPESLEKRFQQAIIDFEDKAVPLPAHWSGYYLKPEEFYFFQYGDHRLNHRFYYQLSHDAWNINCLQP